MCVCLKMTLHSGALTKNGALLQYLLKKIINSSNFKGNHTVDR